jgi:nitrate/nitrite-specific signal transduction histidine kinase
MRERAARVRGSLEFTSVPGKGTAIHLRIPLAQNAEPHMAPGLARP